jgi:hypothetical protein
VSSTYRLRTLGLTWRELGDALVVLDLTESVYLSVSGAGRVIWSRLAEGTATLEQLVTAVLEQYEIDPETARADAESFLHELSRRKLLAG